MFTKDGELDNGSVVWAYSFWARRFREKQNDQAYSILQQIQDHYGELD